MPLDPDDIMTVTAHAIKLTYDANSDYTSSKTIYKADKNLFASHSNYESELQHSPSLGNLETEKASIRISAPWLTPRYSHLRGKSVTSEMLPGFLKLYAISCS